MSATRQQLLDALAKAVKPCAPIPGNWYSCRGDDNPTAEEELEPQQPGRRAAR